MTDSPHKKLKALISEIPDMAWLKDAEGRFMLVNPGVAAACGMGANEIIGKSVQDIWPEELAERYAAEDREVMLSGKAKTIVEYFINVGGHARWIETIKKPIHDVEGRAIGTSGIARDITERMRTEKALEELSQHFIRWRENGPR